MKNKNILELKKDEKLRIINFICEYVGNNEPICVLVSGGLDSDVTARLCSEAVGAERIRLVFILQDGLEERYRNNVKLLAKDLGVRLDEIDLRGLNIELIKAVEQGSPDLFDSKSLLDPNRAKCSLRTAVISSYQDKEFLIAGASNRTEIELGFFMPFGDNMAHFKPIAHLYKTQVIQLAMDIGCRQEVIEQSPSAAFWKNQEDLVDLSYWIINRAPIMGKERKFTDEDDRKMESIRRELTQEAIDTVLYALYSGYDIKTSAKLSGLNIEYVDALRDITYAAKKNKTRPLLQSISLELYYA